MRRIGRRSTRLLDDLRNRSTHWELKEEAKDQNDGNNSLSIDHYEEAYLIIIKIGIKRICKHCHEAKI